MLHHRRSDAKPHALINHQPHQVSASLRATHLQSQQVIKHQTLVRTTEIQPVQQPVIPSLSKFTPNCRAAPSVRQLQCAWQRFHVRAHSSDDPVTVATSCPWTLGQPTGQQVCCSTEEDMSPLFMDTGYNSPVSVSDEGSNSAGMEIGGEGQEMGNKGRKRQEKNRDAARKSRRKQTERADELHEELQSLERSNSALKKEIAALKKDLHLYTTALEHHEPFCRLKASASSSSPTTCPSVSPSADRQAGPSPPGVPPRASSSTLAPTPLTSILGLQTHDCVESTHLSSSTPPTTSTLASPISSPAELFTSSSSVTSPYSGSFSAVPAPHSLFSEPLNTSRPANVQPVCTSLVSNPVCSGSLTTTAHLQSGQGPIHESSSVSATASFSPLHSGALDAFLMKQDFFHTAPSNVVPPYPRSAVQDGGLVAQGCSMNVLQLNPSQFSRNLISSSASLLPPALQDPPLQPPLALSTTTAFALKPRSSQQGTVNPESLLSLLTVPSPLNVPQTTSSSYDGPLSQPQPPLPTLTEPIRDLSLSELLEVNDWILSGTSNE